MILVFYKLYESTIQGPPGQTSNLCQKICWCVTFIYKCYQCMFGALVYLQNKVVLLTKVICTFIAKKLHH